MSENLVNIDDMINEEIGKMNKALSDEEMAMVTGGVEEPTGNHAFKVGETVYWTGREEKLGKAKVLSVEWTGFYWMYTVNFTKFDRTCQLPENVLHY